MKPLAIIVGTGLVLYAALSLAFPTYTHRYRLTLEVDTPKGLRSGSSVIEVQDFTCRLCNVMWVPLVHLSSFSYRGQAVFVDLGEGKNVLALLANGHPIHSTDNMTTLWVQAYGRDRFDHDAWFGRVKLRGPVDLPPSLVPSLVTFLDLDDPKSARQPDPTPASFEAVIGPGYRYRRAWLEMTNDAPVIDIGSYLPWWRNAELNTPRSWKYQAYPLRHKMAGEARLAMNNYSRVGPSLDPSALFQSD